MRYPRATQTVAANAAAFIKLRPIHVIILVAIAVAGISILLLKASPSVESKEMTTVFAANRGGAYVNLKDGKALRVSKFDGPQDAADALRTGAASARSLTRADFDSNGTPDVVAGYALNNAGLLTIHQGNPEAYAPTDETIYTRIQQGYNPEPFLPQAQVFQVPEPVDFLAAGDFNRDSEKDILAGSRNGSLFLLARKDGVFESPIPVSLPGALTALTTGEFRAADGKTDIAIAVDGFNGPQVLVYDGHTALNGEPMIFQLSAPAVAVEFGELDSDPFMDLSVIAGNEGVFIHGWGRKRNVNPQQQVEKLQLGFQARGMALGLFVWNRDAKKQVAILGDNGTTQIFHSGELRAQPFTEQELAERGKARLLPKRTDEDVELVVGWQPSAKKGWDAAREFHTNTDTGAAGNRLFKAHLSGAETDNLMFLDSRSQVKVVQQFSQKYAPEAQSIQGTTDISEASLSLVGQPSAILAMPPKINGERSLIMLQSGSPDLATVPENVVVASTVDRTDDTNSAAAQVCGAGPMDCSLRGAITKANGNATDPTNPAANVITLPAGTYLLIINGAGGCVNGAESNANGDLEINNSTTIVGGGMTTTIIRQTGTGNAGFPGDRVMCLNTAIVTNRDYVFSGFTIAGGFDRSSIGGGGLVGGAKDNFLSLTNIRITNNDNSALNNYSGGGLSITGGDVTITNSLIGGPTAADSDPAVSNDRTDLTRGNYAGTSGGGVGYSPGDPNGALPSPGVLTITGTTIQGNKARSGAGGGGGADLFFHNGGTGSFTINGGSIIDSNTALQGNGGGILVESLHLTVDNSTVTNNATVLANTRGGGIYLSGGGMSFGSSTSFSNNSVGLGVVLGKAISVNTGGSPTTGVFVTGGSNNINDNVEILPNGVWTNNAGTSTTFLNLTLAEGTFVANNSTLTVNQDLNLNSFATADTPVFTGGSGTHTITGNLNIVEGTYTATSGTTNMAGNFNLTGGSFVHNSGTFIFNGTGSQSITGVVTFNNLTDSNITQPLTINNNIGANGSLNVNGVNAVLAPVPAAVISGSGTLTGTGTARVTRTAATADFSSQYTITNKTLTNLTVEYIGGSAQVLSAITYGPLKINNGSGVNLAGAGTATVGGLLTLQTGALGVGTGTLVINNGSTVVGGSITSSATGTVNYNQGSAGQNVLAFNYGNLTFSNFNKNLPASTVGIAGTFTPGTATGHTITGNTINFNGAGAQTIPAFQYNNLTISGARGGANVTLVNGGTISVLGAFSPTATAVNYVVTNNTFDYNATGAQTVAAFNYNNLTISQNRGGAALTLASGNIGIAGVFNPTLTNNTFVTAGNTVIFNGSAAQSIPAFTFNGLTISNAAGVNLSGPVTVGGALSLTSGALGVNTQVLTLNGAASSSGGTLTSSNTGTVNYNQGSNGQGVLAGSYGNLTFSNFNKTLASTGTIGISNVFTPGTATGHTITGSTIDFNGTGAQTVPAFNYNNLTISGARGANNVTLANSGIIGIAGVFSPTATFAGGSIIITGSTIEYNGTSAQVMPAAFTTYNNLNLNNAAGVTGFAGLTVQGLLNVKSGTFTSSSTYNNVTIDALATLTATAGSTINVTGIWTNNGTFNGSTGTVAFNGSAAQTIGGSSVTAFTNLTIANSAGVSLTQNATVNGTLTLNSDLTTGANTLTQPSTAPASAGAFDVVGNVRRTGAPLPTAVAMTFGNLNNIITFNAVGTTPNEVTINLVKSAPVSFPSAVQRTYTITPTGGAGFSGTLRLRYLDAELNGNIESQLDLWRFNGATFVDEQQTSRDSVNNWVQKTGVTTFSPWTFATHVNAAPAVTAATTVVNAQTTSGLVITADAIDGAAVTHFKITNITNGTLFKNDGVTAINNNDFITLAEGNAGLKFTPALNSIAAGSFNVQASSDAIGTGLSAAATGTITVNQGSTTTTITLDSPDPSGTGVAVTVNFTVTVDLPSSGTPSGNVVITVNDASGDTCNGNLSGGSGTCNLTLTTSGSKTLTATYGGETLFLGSIDTEPHVVNGPPVAVDDNYSSLKGSTLNVAAPGVLANDTGSPTDVTAIAAGPTTAGGTVTLNSNGSFTYNPPTAVFTGPDSFTYTANNAFGSDSGTVNITVVEAFFINEVLFDPPGTDAPNEYIELRGPASATIPAGTYLVAIEGDSAENPGDVQTIINLSGLSFGSNGFLVLLQNGNTYTTAAGTTVLTSTTAGFGGLPGAIFSADAAATDLEDSSVSFLLIQTVTAPTLTDDIDTDDNGSTNAPYSGWTVLDSIGALNAGANVRGYAAYHYRNVAGTGSSIGAETIVNFIPSYVGRNGDSIGATAADWVTSGGLAGTAPNFTLNATDTEPIAFANQPLNHIGATNFDISPPTVTSITRASTNPTNAASVDFTVTFSENVTGVDAADFALTTTGSIAGASVGLIGAAGNVFTVTVNTGTGDGTIRLDLIDNNTIIDGANNPLGGAGVQSFTTGEVYTVDKTVPTVNIVDVTPDPRSTSVSSISIVFSEAITGFDLADLSLTRNGGGNLLTGSQTLTSADNITWTLGNLSSITSADGTYVLTLTAASSSIADGVGNALAAGDSDTWLMDGNAPTVDITDVTPDPRNTSVGSIAIVFSEAITGFDLADLSLTRDGGANLLTGAQTLTSGDNINWTLGNLSGLTGTSGTYLLTLTAPGGIQDGSANALASGATDSWVVDATAPTVDIVDVTPDPRNTSVTSISIVFSEAITGFDLADLSLTRDGGANLLTGSQTLTSGDNLTWTLGNLSTLTGADGNYALTLTSGGIADNAGNALAAGASDTWVVNGAPPTVDITDVTPDPRNTTVSSIAIVFSEAVTGFDMADLSLTRNGGANLLTGAQTLTSGDNINWTLNNLAGLTGADGTYTLTLTAPGGITDAGGASLTGGATDSWVMDATGPSVTINQASGQADPTSASPINFTVVFNEPVANFITGDVALSGTAGATTAVVTETAPNNGTTYNVAVSGMTSSGTVIAVLNAGVASDALGNLSQASTTTDNTVTFVLITNNAPVLDIAGNFSLNAIDEDIANASNAGTLISDIIASAGGDRITDADAGAVEGIAIIGVDSSNGTWEFSLNNGASWAAAGDPDPPIALLLASDANTRLRFIPNANFNGTVNPGILFRAWDQTSGTNGGIADTTTNGGQTAFSASSDTASITVNAVNDPPSFTKGADQVVSEDAGAQTVPGWATNILAGPANESGQTLTFLVTTNNDSLFAVLPAISPTGTLTYTPAANASGVITVFVALQDNGGDDDTSPVQTFTITINAVNDTPTANAQSVNTNEDTPLGITLTGSDAETPSGSLIFTVTVLPTNGVLSGSGANRTYTPNAGYNGPDSFKFTVTDTGVPALTSTEATVSINVDAVNDAPTNTVPGAQATNTNTPLIFSAGNGNQISIADSDAGVAAVQVTLTATNGTLTLSTAGGLVFSVGDSTAEPTMTFSGSLAHINDALNGLAFTPTSGFNGAASLQIVTNDQGNTGSGGALSDTDSVNITVTSGGTLQFSSSTYTVAENGGPATITITRAGGSAGTATVLFETSNGTADSGDYTTVSQTVTFVDGDTSETVNVPITNDTDPEADQTVNLTLSNAGGTGTLGAPSTAVLTITNDDFGGTLQFSALTYTVAENAGPAVITITRTGGASGTATVLFQTSNGTADSGDYTTVSETVTFLNGEVSKTVNVPITNDTDNEPNQTVNLTLSNAGGTGTLGTPATAVLTIENDDQPKFVFAAVSYNVGEAGPSLTVTVNRTGDPNVAATVDVATNDFMAALCSTVAGTASAKCDYATAGGRLRFAAGQTSKTVVLSIVDDVFVEGNETLTMALSNPTAGSALGTPSLTTITIQDNDSNPNAANPFPQNPFFVRMQYLDFLLREPDTAGFNDWLNVLNNCAPNQGFLGSNPACDRVHVSSGFFRSTEFGERGYWVYRFFEASLGRRPTFEEFTPEMRRLSGLKPAAELDQDEADFINEFMAKPEFTAKYAGLTTAAQAAAFIAALEQTAGVTLPATVPPTQPGQPTQYGRQELINLMSAGTLTPAQTLRAFIEQKVVWDKNFYKAFVAMQYFGYLRRNPDNAGYDDWLDVLTNGRPAQGIPPGDFRHLVFGFVYSVEYRERFGQP